LPNAAESTIVLLLKGYVLGLLLAVGLTAFANVSRIGADLLETLTSMFHPLPSIALLPIAFIWFGLGDNGVIFVIVHAVLWSVALNTHAGFRAVSPTLRMVGRNYGLSTTGYITRILIPGAFPHPDRFEIRMGLCLAHTYCRGTGLRRVPDPEAWAGLFSSVRIS
jgi:NitT/TauT family transport system permease protein